MKLFIPELKTQLRLTADWTFSLRYEDRNKNYHKLINPEGLKKFEEVSKAQYDAWWISMRPENRGATLQERQANEERIIGPARKAFRKIADNPPIITLPKGTVLEVDRIYIRQGNSDFSSLTFKIRTGKRVIRFWAKLEDVNNIECEVVKSK